MYMFTIRKAFGLIEWIVKQFWDAFILAMNLPSTTRNERIVVYIMIVLFILLLLTIFIVIFRLIFNRLHKKVVAVEEKSNDVVVKPHVKEVSQGSISIEIEDYINKHVLVLKKALEESFNTKLLRFKEEYDKLDTHSNHQSIVEKAVPEVIPEQNKSVSEAVTEEPKPVSEVVVEKPKPAPEVFDEDERDPFFDKKTDIKYIVCKHSISGWQIRKSGSKRAHRVFNSKKLAVAYADKSKFDYEIN